MINLIFNPEVRTKTTFAIPILYGDILYKNKKLSSFSIYENNQIKEIRFVEKQVLKYYYDKNLVLSRIETYDQISKLISVVNFELKREHNNRFQFREFVKPNEVGNYIDVNKIDNDKYELSFHRVNSHLGYKISATLFGQDLRLLKEEHYYSDESGTSILSNVLCNEYEMKFSLLENLSNKILAEGWHLSEDEIEKIEKY